MNNEQNGSRIILALDVDTVEKAVELMDAVQGQVGMVKIGIELINAQIAGEVAEEAASRNLGVFWDAKLDDIPTSVGKATTVVAGRKGIRMINVHGSAGIEAVRAVVANQGGMLTLVVTVLTSRDTESTELDFGASRNAKVLHFARMALLADADGIICSPKELSFLNKYPETRELIKVVPGTRSPGADAHDQKNVETQEATILNGADWLVIGREITEAKAPSTSSMAATGLNIRIAQALAEREKGAVAK